MTVAMNDDSELTAVISNTGKDGTTKTATVEPEPEPAPEMIKIFWCEDGVLMKKWIPKDRYDANPDNYETVRPTCGPTTEVVADQVSASPGLGSAFARIENTWWMAQTFTCGKSGSLVKLDLEIFGEAPAKRRFPRRSRPDGDVIVLIHSAPGGDLNAGARLGIATIKESSIGSPPDGSVSVAFDPGIKLIAGKAYAFELSIAKPATGGYALFTAGNYGGAGEAWKTIDGDTFKKTGGGEQLVFKTYMEVAK
jgi:hypothetical protein